MTTTANSDQHIFIKYDHKARASYQVVSDKKIVGTVECEDGTLLDVDADGNVVGIERFY